MKAETKFNPGEFIWTLIDFKAKECEINSIEVIFKKEKIDINYFLKVQKENDFDIKLINEENCFLTKNELIDKISN